MKEHNYVSKIHEIHHKQKLDSPEFQHNTKKDKLKKVKSGFSYNSGDNDEWETIDSLRGLVKEFVDPNFEE